MGWWRPLVDLGLFAVSVTLFLGSIQAFVDFRRRHAAGSGRASSYVAHADPWLPAAVILAGVGVVFLLRLIG